MATRKQFKIAKRERPYRYFSEDFRRKIVKEIENNISTVVEVSRAYEVSRPAIYQWIHKYSVLRKKKLRLVVESKSEARKRLFIEQKVKELEQIVGQKQIEIDFLNKMIEIAGKELKVDIKKKFSIKHSNGSGATVKNISTK